MNTITTLRTLADSLEYSTILVAKPHGVPCKRRKCLTIHFKWNGIVYRSNGKYNPISLTSAQAGTMDWDDIVQPVILIPLVEWQP